MNKNLAKKLNGKTVKIMSVLAGFAMLTNTAAAANLIYGTYLVTYDVICVKSPWRNTATPAFLTMSTPDGNQHGYVQIPLNATVQEQSAISRVPQSGKYLLKINPLNNTLNISSGTYNDAYLGLASTGGSTPMAVAGFGTFSGGGTFMSVTDNIIDVNTYNTALASEGVSQVVNTNALSRWRTQDNGGTFLAFLDGALSGCRTLTVHIETNIAQEQPTATGFQLRINDMLLDYSNTKTSSCALIGNCLFF